MRNTQATRMLFELHSPGRRGARLPAGDVPARPLTELLPAGALAEAPPPLPELSEPDVIRHFVNLSTKNMSVDTHFYPLGSCTMKYNPKRNERLASLPGLVDLHPQQPPAECQGMLELLFEMQRMLGEIAGLPAVSLQPAAGAQGEFTALLVASAWFRSRGEQRTRVLFPASAHGTNPASAALAGFECVQLKGTAGGFVDLDELQAQLDGRTAVFMVTNPNTLGMFERDLPEIARRVHAAGGLVYIDGANMNAICGITRPGDFGADMMHYNVHKTFTGPHGAGGPGSGPIAVRDMLEPFLPSPMVIRDEKGGYCLQQDRPLSIGHVRAFFGNVGVLLRGWMYLRTLGPNGLREVSEQAVLNANYLLTLLRDHIDVPKGAGCMHEFVASAKNLRREKRVSAMDIAKRLLDKGYHSPTVYFPLVVAEALMIEPTETESQETLERFAEVFVSILREDPETLHEAPHDLAISRPDEVAATKQPVLRWKSA